MNTASESSPALTPTASKSSAYSSDSSDPSATTQLSVKRVSFCPLALLIGVAGEGEVEQAMVQAAQQQMGKRKVAVRTYSIEAPNLGEVAGKAWHSVVNGFTSSLEPFLHPGGGPAAGVCSASRARESSPERERDLALSASRSRSRSRSPSPGGRGRSSDSAYGRGERDDPTFIPNSPTRLKLKIPTLRRECSNPGGTSPCGRPILRRPSVTSPSTSSPPLPPLPDSSAVESTITAFSTASSSSAPPPRLYPTLSRTPSRPSPSPLHPTAGLIVPLQPCCQRCEAATVYGSSASSSSSRGKGYKEHWSAGAKKQREEEQARRLEREGWAEDARKIAAKYGYEGGEGLRKSETLEEKEAREVEELARGSRLGRIAERGDVDDLADKRKHSSHAVNDVGASSTVDVEEGDEMEEVEVLGVVEPAGEQGLLATVISEEPASMELDAVDAPSCAEFDQPSSSSPTVPSSSPWTSRSPRPVPPSKVPTPTASHSPSASSSPSRPSKRRLSSTSSAAKPLPPSAPPPAPKHSLSFSQRLTSLGASFLQGANAGMGGAGGGAVRAG